MPAARASHCGSTMGQTHARLIGNEDVFRSIVIDEDDTQLQQLYNEDVYYVFNGIEDGVYHSTDKILYTTDYSIDNEGVCYSTDKKMI